MATVAVSTVAATKVRLTANNRSNNGTNDVWFSTWGSLSGGALDSGYALTDRTIVLVTNTTAVTVTATYVNGRTITLTAPAEGSLSVDQVIPTGAVGYSPKTRLRVTYTPAASPTTPWVSGWTGTTSTEATNPNVAYYLTDTTSSAATISVTLTATLPALYRAVTVTSPATDNIAIEPVT